MCIFDCKQRRFSVSQLRIEYRVIKTFKAFCGDYKVLFKAVFDFVVVALVCTLALLRLVLLCELSDCTLFLSGSDIVILVAVSLTWRTLNICNYSLCQICIPFSNRRGRMSPLLFCHSTE